MASSWFKVRQAERIIDAKAALAKAELNLEHFLATKQPVTAKFAELALRKAQLEFEHKVAIAKLELEMCEDNLSLPLAE